jgi:ribosomal protein S18 acetylase RimI-like enzyme
MQLRIADSSDAEACFQLSKKLELRLDEESSSGPTRLEESGFLLPTTKSAMSELIEAGITMVCIGDTELVGFISGFGCDSNLFAGILATSKHVCWSVPDPLELPNPVYVNSIGVAPGYQRQGIASNLYCEFIKHFPKPNLFTAIVEKPIRNLASPQFFRGLGFSRVGLFRVEEFKGLRNYESGIYLKTSPSALM